MSTLLIKSSFQGRAIRAHPTIKFSWWNRHLACSTVFLALLYLT
jgi:hypothetical protein